MGKSTLRTLAACALCGALSGCGLTAREWGGGVAGVLVASDAGYLKAPFVGAAYLFYTVLDPAAPNWGIEEARQGEDRYALVLTMKAIHSGGDGEARQVFGRRAAQLGRQEGFEGYDILSYQEGVESTRPVARKVAYGEVRLRRAAVVPTAPVADSPR